MKNFTLILWLLVGAEIATILLHKERYVFLYVVGYTFGYIGHMIDRSGE